MFGDTSGDNTISHAFNVIDDRLRETTKQKMKNMKNLKMLLCVAIVTLAMTSCGTVGVVGSIYTGETQPADVTSNVLGTKVGTAKCFSVLGLVAVGDAGINAAAKNGNITKISHVDRKTMSVLGVYTEITYIVYGE